MEKKRTDIFASGLALFSMFFGAGNLVWPLVLGEGTGSLVFSSLGGLLITAVLFPLIGLFAIMLFEGNTQRFFGQMGRKQGAILLFLVQAIIGPLGSIPRLLILAHGTLAAYLPLPLPLFSFIASLLVYFLLTQSSRLITLLGCWLTPALLFALGAIVTLGLIGAPSPEISLDTSAQAFGKGLITGYNTLDLIASFLFGALIYQHFKQKNTPLGNRQLTSRFLPASLLAALLLGLVYGGLTIVASRHLPHLPEAVPQEVLFYTLALSILGPIGGALAALAVALACLTTALSLTAIFADYLRDLSGQRINRSQSLGIGLAISFAMSILGFESLSRFLFPILQIAYPGLIVLSLLTIATQLLQKKPVKWPVLAAFGLSIGWAALPMLS